MHGHFGSASYYTIYDSEKDGFEVIDNSNQHHAHGMCHPRGALEDKFVWEIMMFLALEACS